MPSALVFLVAAQVGVAPATPCVGTSPVAITLATATKCQAFQLLRQAEGLRSDDRRRRQLLESAAAAFRRAADTTRVPDERIEAVEPLALIYDSGYLNVPPVLEAVLRELAALSPTDTGPLFRLAAFYEREEQIDAAEETLQSARRLQPETLEPYRRLAQFYARRARGLQPSAASTRNEPADAGRPDARGVYRVGGGIEPPRREGVPITPEEARLANVQGAVVIEIVVNEHGQVADAAVVRSVPLLDAEAVRAVREWRFAPTIVDGKAVPVRMNVTVSFAR